MLQAIGSQRAADNLATEQQEQTVFGVEKGEKKEREKDSERYPIFNEVIPDFQHAVTFLVLSLSEIYFQAFSRPLIYPISLNLPCLRQVHIPCQACRRPLGLRGSILTRSEEPHL